MVLCHAGFSDWVKQVGPERVELCEGEGPCFLVVNIVSPAAGRMKMQPPPLVGESVSLEEQRRSIFRLYL